MIRNVYGDWSKEFGDKIVKEYKFAKKVFLEKKDPEEKRIINKIQNILIEKGFKNEEFIKNTENNSIFKFDEEFDFSIIRASSYFENDTFEIIDCVILFLTNTENEFLKFLNQYTNKAKIGNVELNFPEIKRVDKTREKSKEIIQEILNDKNLSNRIEENELVDFFENKTIVYCAEIGKDEVRNLKEVGRKQLKGKLIEIVSSKEISTNEVLEIIKDIDFYIGDNSNINTLYTVKKDKNYKEIKIKIILVV